MNQDEESGHESLAEKRTHEAEERSEMASERTDFAEDRTLLANERTFAGWSKASFASIGLGLGFQALFKSAEPTWTPKAWLPFLFFWEFC